MESSEPGSSLLWTGSEEEKMIMMTISGCLVEFEKDTADFPVCKSPIRFIRREVR